MKITKQMILQLQRRIQDCIFRKMKRVYQVSIVPQDKKVFCIISALGDVEKDSYYYTHLGKFNALINDASDLIWKFERDIYVLESGYVVFYDYDYDNPKYDKKLESYWVWDPEEGEFDYRAWYIDGQEQRSEDIVEFDVNVFEFAQKAPNEKELLHRYDYIKGGQNG